MSILTRFYTVETDADGVLMQNVVVKGSTSLKIRSGRVHQIIIDKIEGDASAFNLDLRYDPESSDNDNLVYLYVDGLFPFIDSNVNAPFSLKVGDVTQTDLAMFAITDLPATLRIRIDYEIDDSTTVKPRAESC
jgi:hypothetical protein